MLYMHGEAAQRAPLSALLQALLLRVHTSLADRAALAVSALSRLAAHQRAGQLPLGRRGHSAPRHPPTVLHQQPQLAAQLALTPRAQAATAAAAHVVARQLGRLGYASEWKRRSNWRRRRRRRRRWWFLQPRQEVRHSQGGEAHRVLLDVRQVHLPPVCAVRRHAHVAHVQADRRRVHRAQGAHRASRQVAQEVLQRPGRPGQRGRAQHRRREARQRGARARDTQRGRAHDRPSRQSAQEQGLVTDESPQQSEPGERDGGGDDARGGARAAHQDQERADRDEWRARAKVREAADREPPAAHAHADDERRVGRRRRRRRHQHGQRLRQRDRAALRLEHVHARRLLAAAAQGGAHLLAAAQRQRPQLAPQGLPGRQRSGAWQLHQRLSRAQRWCLRDLKVTPRSDFEKAIKNAHFVNVGVSFFVVSDTSIEWR